MNDLAGKFALVFSVLVGAASARAATLPDPFDTQDIRNFLNGQSVPSADAFLASLPESQQKNMVFVHTSRSLQAATKAAPRQILFGWDARMIVAAGGEPEDTIEIAAFDPASGRYHFQEITFSEGQGTLNEAPTACAACHGQPERPIWHSYGEWPGVYGSEAGDVLADDVQPFGDFATSIPSRPRYNHLKLSLESDGFLLLDRVYPFPNTVMNFVLGSTVSVGVVARLKQSPRYERSKWAVLALSSVVGCDRNSAMAMVDQIAADYARELELNEDFKTRFGASATDSEQIMLFRLMGIDPGPELNLTEMSPGAPPRPKEFWSIGGNSVDDFIAELLFNDLAPTDAVLQPLFAKMLPEIASDVAWITATGTARIPLENYPFIRTTFAKGLDSNSLANVCHVLQSRYLNQ